MPDFGNTSNKTVNKVIEWLEIRFATRPSNSNSWSSIRIDASKSALLKRLLDGKKAFPYRPPCAYSYPWYELLEDGQGFVNDIYYHHGISAWKEAKDPQLNICQEMWQILESFPNPEAQPTYPKHAQNTYIAKYTGGEDNWEVSFLGYDEAMLFRLNADAQAHNWTPGSLKENIHWAEKWFIKKLPSPSIKMILELEASDQKD